MKDLLTLLNEDNPLRPTQKKSKQGWWFLASVMIGCTICVPVFYMGVQLSQQLSYTDFVLAVFVGGLLLSLIGGATGIVGQRTGLPTSMLARVAFGSKGSMAVNLALAIGCIGWFGIQTSVFSKAFVALAQQVWGWEVNLLLATVISGLIMSTTAVVGFRGLGKLAYLATPLLVVLLVLPLWILYRAGDLAGVTGFAPGTEGLAFGTVVAIVAGAYSSSTTMPDFTRFMVNASATVKGIVANFFLAYPLLLILTGTVAIATQQPDFMQIMILMGFGTLAIVVLFLSTWTTNDTNVYSGALAVNPFVPKIARWQLAAAIGVFGTLFAVMGIFEHFMSWLIFTGNLYAPMAGVYVADYWLNKSRYANLSKLPAFRWPQLLAWVSGLLVGLCTTGTGDMGLGLFTLTTVPMVDAMLAAALIQLLLHKVLK